MKFIFFLFLVGITINCRGQAFDSSRYSVQVDTSKIMNRFFRHDKNWLGADGAASIDLENGKLLWLFSDSFIAGDSGTRKQATIIRNSIAVQDGYNPETATVQFYFNQSKKIPGAFFEQAGKSWFWLGHGIMLKDRLLIFLMNEKAISTGLGFETTGWSAVLIFNPHDDPRRWKMTFIKGINTFGSVAGSAAVLKDQKFVYAYGAVEPGNHEVYLLRWNLNDAWSGNLSKPEWWMNGKWAGRRKKDAVPTPLFSGITEYSVHYDSSIKKFIQVQSFGFGEANIGIRLADKKEGPWSSPYTIYKPDYAGIKKPFMYAAKAHPEMKHDGVYITYNINSFDFDELLANDAIYFPRFISFKIIEKKKP